MAVSSVQKEKGKAYSSAKIPPQESKSTPLKEEKKPEKKESREFPQKKERKEDKSISDKREKFEEKQEEKKPASLESNMDELVPFIPPPIRRSRAPVIEKTGLVQAPPRNSALEESLSAVQVRETPKRNDTLKYTESADSHYSSGTNALQKGGYETMSRPDDFQKLRSVLSSSARTRAREPSMAATDPRIKSNDFRNEFLDRPELKREMQQSYEMYKSPAEVSMFNDRDDLRKYSTRKKLM